MTDGKLGQMVWIDLEMTGLDIFGTDEIIEAALVITDYDLNIVHKLGPIAIKASEAVITKMNPEVLEMHTKSGVLQRSRNSTISVAEAETMMLNAVNEHVENEKPLLCGNSVYMDRFFIRKYMPRLHKRLHYREIDVSTLKQIGHMQGNVIPYEKSGTHEAMADILDSIKELRYYYDNLLVKNKIPPS